MKKLISSIIMLILSAFVVIFELVTGPTIEVLVAGGLLVIASIIWLVMDILNLKKSKVE